MRNSFYFCIIWCISAESVSFWKRLLGIFQNFEFHFKSFGCFLCFITKVWNYTHIRSIQNYENICNEFKTEKPNIWLHAFSGKVYPTKYWRLKWILKKLNWVNLLEYQNCRKWNAQLNSLIVHVNIVKLLKRFLSFYSKKKKKLEHQFWSSENILQDLFHPIN